MAESALNWSLEQGVRAKMSEDERKELEKKGKPVASAGPCRVCGRPNPAVASVCTSCGIPLRQAPKQAAMAPSSAAGLWWLKPTLVTLFIATLAVGGQWFRIGSEDHNRNQRLRAALGPAATDKDVETLNQRASGLGVTPESLIQVNRKCFLTPERVPSDVEMAQAVVGAEAGEARARKLVEFAVRRCVVR